VQRGFRVKGVVRRPGAAETVVEAGGEPIIVRDFDRRQLTVAFAGCEAVIHLIGIVNERHATFETVNVRGTRRVLATAAASRVSRFVTPSGLGVDQYGVKPWATNGYFASKLAIERLCREQPIPFVVFRPSYILGPGDELLPGLIDAILHGAVSVAGAGDSTMQPLYVGDAATTFLRAATGAGRANAIYDLVGPEPITYTQLVPRVAAIMADEGFRVPPYTVTHVPLDRAAHVLGLAPEEVDVTQSDVRGDPAPVTRDFRIAFTPLDTAIRAAVRAERREARR
jgi:NADH dehydrogenase